MTNSADTSQWLVVGWPLNRQAHVRRDVDAVLYEFTDSVYTRTTVSIPVQLIGLERLGDWEIAPGVLALDQAPDSRRTELLDCLPEDYATDRTWIDPAVPWMRLRVHSSWSIAAFVSEFCRIQQDALHRGGARATTPQRTMTDWETARRIYHLIAIYFGIPALQAAVSDYNPGSTADNRTLQVVFETPVDSPSLVHMQIERDTDGLITLMLWYRFGTQEPWHRFCDHTVDRIFEFHGIASMRAVIAELVAFANQGLTRDEIITYLGRLHDEVNDSEWSRSQLAATDAIDERIQPTRSKLTEMISE